MSYQVLARKWRPKDFSELVGQQQTARALMNALESQRLHHAYLFTGTRGVGKTTIARILSKSLNCETGITSKPCGECASCVEISQGNFVDLLEIDAASKTKVEDTRELLDNVQYRPTRGRYKVYLIDEVHMLSGHSFNALLKTLEEPPPHVVFLLATTDPQKMPVTVLSRCLQFHLRRMEEGEIESHLAHILNAENIPFEAEALPAIAKGADGSMRDALSLLDQAIAYCGDEIKSQVVLDMLGSLDREYSFQLLEAIESSDAKQLMSVIESIAQYSPDFNELIADWLSLLHQIAVCQATQTVDDPKIKSWAETISVADLQLYYQLSLHAKRDLVYAPHPRQGFEMAMLRIMALKPQTSPSNGTKLKSNSENRSNDVQTNSHSEPQPQLTNSDPTSVPSNGVTVEAVASPEYNSNDTNAVAQLSQPNSTSVAVALNPLTQTPYQTEHQVSPSKESSNAKTSAFNNTNVKNKAQQIKESIKNNTKLTMVVDNDVKQEPNLQEQHQSQNQKQLTSQQNANSQSSKLPNVDLLKYIELEEVKPDVWFNVVACLELTGHGLQVLSNATAKFENNCLLVNPLRKIESLLTPSAKGNILEAAKKYFKTSKITIDYIFVDETTETPRERIARLHELAIDDAQNQLHVDPQIKFLMEKLSATLPRESIQLNQE